VIAFPRLLELAFKHNSDFAQAYADADGNTRQARKILRSKLISFYGLDPATIAMIFALIQLAFKVWKWAKDNGYLSAYDPSDAPTGYILQTAWDAGEFDGGDDESDDE
jgi:hypothetical protein